MKNTKSAKTGMWQPEKVKAKPNWVTVCGYLTRRNDWYHVKHDCVTFSIDRLELIESCGAFSVERLDKIAENGLVV